MFLICVASELRFVCRNLQSILLVTRNSQGVLSIPILQYSNTPLLRKTVESNRGLMSPLSGGQSKPGPMGLDSLLVITYTSNK